ncbi:MAG: retron system putative HNH endonuclease [Mariprofundales bacterium]
MRYIKKGYAPEELLKWQRKKSQHRYKDLSEPKASEIRQAIRSSCLREQFYLCAYCCQRITLDKCHNEHVEPQDIAPNRTLDYDNIVVSCNEQKQCGKAHGKEKLLLTPLMQECETELSFHISGEVKGQTVRASDCIMMLNLNNKLLKYKRKSLAGYYLNFEDVEIKECISALEKPDNGKMEYLSPVLINMLTKYISL